MNATKQVAIHANASNDVHTAYFYHRKSELLKTCLELGVKEFFIKIHDPNFALEFFDRIGPPPGYDEDYFNQLAESYKEGDHLQHQLRRQDYDAGAMQLEDGFDLVPLDNDASLVDDVRQLLKAKYHAVPAGETNDLVMVLILDEQVTVALRSQMQERTLLVQEFVQTGMPLMLNWLLAMPTAARFSVVEQCFSDVVLLSPLDGILSARQRRHLLPEISDIPMLVGDDLEPLKSLFVRIAGGQENSFAWNVGVAGEIEEASISFKKRLASTPEAHVPALISEIDRWARDQAREHWFNVPAVLRLEHLIESTLVSYGALEDLNPSHEHDFDSFINPFTLYRTRGLQLLALSLIEKCLKTCLPSNPPAHNKKRKRHM